MKQRTIIYVDGFNLYYGCLKNSPYKWLDLKGLFAKLLNETHEIVKIKYFTAFISNREDNEASRLRQRYYLKAISHYIPEAEIYYGHYLTHAVNARLADPEQGKSPFVRVLRTEEKGSDVNLAVHLLNDAWLDAYDCAVLVSNDSDIAESMRLVKAHHPKKIGLIFPNTDKQRKPSKQLIARADFVKEIRHHILKKSQLPSHIPNTNFSRPSNW
jgi:uncharacterized LabA/DUF88 family protein